MKKTNRILSAVMAMSMVVGMTSVTAFADDVALKATSTAVSSTGIGADIPYINVTVPVADQGNVYLNPYKLGGKPQVYSDDLVVTNNSELPVTLTITNPYAATATGSTPSLATYGETDSTKLKTLNTVSASLNVVDGSGVAKATALKPAATGTNTNADIVVAQQMAPFGGEVTINVTGTTKNAAEGNWTNDDKLSVSYGLKFKAADTAAVYTPTAKGKLLVTPTNESELPNTLIAGKIEIPVDWTITYYSDEACTTAVDGVTDDTAAAVVENPAGKLYAKAVPGLKEVVYVTSSGALAITDGDGANRTVDPAEIWLNGTASGKDFVTQTFTDCTVKYVVDCVVSS